MIEKVVKSSDQPKAKSKSKSKTNDKKPDETVENKKSQVSKEVKDEPVVSKGGNDDMKPEDEDFTFHFSVFSLIYMVGFLVHSRRKMRNDVFMTGGLITIYIAFRKFKNQIFLSFLAYCICSTIYQSPYNANHHNMCGFVSLLLLPQQIRRCLHGNVKKAGTADALNNVRIAIILMYLLAAFHKLNTDFFNPAVSCSFDKVWRYFELIGFDPDDDLKNIHFFMTTVPYQVIFIEVVPPIMLAFPKFQRPAIFTLITLHTVLLPVGFADFGSIAQSFLWLFVSPKAVKQSGLNKHFFTDMAAVFVFFEAVTMFVWYRTPDMNKVPFGNAEVSLVFLAFALMWSSIFRTNDVPGPKVYHPKSAFGVICLLSFVWFAFNPYFGLRTAGCLTMFSNLKTEGPRSNHLLLGSNPLKIFGFQDDIVEVKEMDPRWEHNLAEGDILTRAHFDFDMARQQEQYGDADDWYMWIEHNGETVESYDSFHDPAFAKYFEPRPLWQRKYLIFRFIQKEGPQECVW